MFQIVSGKPAILPARLEGCWILLDRSGIRDFHGVCRLELDPDSPLTPRTQGFERLTKALQLELAAGVWWCGIVGHPDHFIVVRDRSMRIVTKAEAYCELGAVERLQALGLDDAAVSLRAGSFDHASAQMIAERERRLKERG